jgi:hypothetical protein
MAALGMLIGTREGPVVARIAPISLPADAIRRWLAGELNVMQAYCAKARV